MRCPELCSLPIWQPEAINQPAHMQALLPQPLVPRADRKHLPCARLRGWLISCLLGDNLGWDHTWQESPGGVWDAAQIPGPVLCQHKLPPVCYSTLPLRYLSLQDTPSAKFSFLGMEPALSTSSSQHLELTLILHLHNSSWLVYSGLGMPLGFLNYFLVLYFKAIC